MVHGNLPGRCRWGRGGSREEAYSRPPCLTMVRSLVLVIPDKSRTFPEDTFDRPTIGCVFHLRASKYFFLFFSFLLLYLFSMFPCV